MAIFRGRPVWCPVFEASAEPRFELFGSYHFIFFSWDRKKHFNTWNSLTQRAAQKGDFITVEVKQPKQKGIHDDVLKCVLLLVR